MSLQMLLLLWPNEKKASSLLPDEYVSLSLSKCYCYYSVKLHINKG